MSNWSGWGDEDEDEEEQETGPVSYTCVCIYTLIYCYETAVIAMWALIRIVTMIGSLCDQGLSDIVD